MQKKKKTEDDIAAFRKGATEFVKFVMGKHDEMQYYVGQQYEMEGLMVCAYTKDDSPENPTFLYMKDGLVEEKF